MNRVRPGFLLAIALILFCVYMATYGARIHSADTLRIMDAASSVARFGDLNRDEAVWFTPPEANQSLDLRYPLIPYERNEPLMVYTVAIFYRLADLLPQVGYVHMMYFTNIIWTIGTALLLVIWGRRLGYDDGTTTITALLFGLGTVAWLYSKFVFREPQVMFLLMLSALTLSIWRDAPRRWGWCVLALGAFIAAILTKNSAIVALPAFCVLLLRDRPQRTLNRVLDGLLITGIITPALVVLIEPLYTLITPILVQMGANPTYTRPALQAYLFSIGGSLWGTSPVLLLGIAGAVLLIRQGKRQLVWVVVLLLAAYAFVHAAYTGSHWFGGLSYPPRFLVPVLPFAMLLVLPVIAHLRTGKGHRVWWWGGGGIVLYAVSIQTIAAVSFTGMYVDLLPPQANRLIEWAGGMTNPRYLRWVLLPQTWSTLGYEIAWWRVDRIGIAFGYLALAGIVTISLGWRSRCARWSLYGLLLMTITLTAHGMRVLYQQDVEYWAQTPALFEVLEIATTRAQDGEPLLITYDLYSKFIMNYSDTSAFRPIGIGVQPGEAISQAVPPRVESDVPAELLTIAAPRMIDHLAQRHDTLWVLAHNTPFIPWSVRPVEQYMNQRYYLVQAHETADPTVRLLQYDAHQAPSPYTMRLPQHTTDLRYGDHIALTGVTLPAGTHYSAGDTVPLSLHWQTDAPLAADYVVATFIVKADAGYPPLQGRDSMPVDGFAPTSTWRTTQPVIDNRALQLPADMPDGRYDVWVLLYAADSGGQVRLPVTAGQDREGDIGVLPLQLSISSER